MNFLKSFLLILLFATCLPLAGQTPAYEELEFELDSTASTYKPAGKNHVLVRSKRGTGGVNKTPAADAILSAEVTEIVLVFSETDPGDIAEREEANQERWENLLRTYPELFQFSTTYKTICQCKTGGDAEAFKQTQGFYVYINGEVPKVAAEAAPPKAEEPKAVAKAEERRAEPKAPEKKAEEKKAPEKLIEETKPAVADKTTVKTPEPPAAKNTEPAKEEPVAAKPKQQEVVKEEEPAEEAKPEKKVAAAPKKKPVVGKARRAKDPKACRYACYGNGDDDLNNFFKDNLKLTKKERKKAKKNPIVVKLQLNLDGTIKKVMVACPDEKLNLLVTEAVKSMNPWNATVKNGVTVKSEVKITLKYDKPTKSLKAMETAVMPKLLPKCNKCTSDSELFD
jgi:hypothetical protein